MATSIKGPITSARRGSAGKTHELVKKPRVVERENSFYTLSSFAACSMKE